MKTNSPRLAGRVSLVAIFGSVNGLCGYSRRNERGAGPRGRRAQGEKEKSILGVLLKSLYPLAGIVIVSRVPRFGWLWT